MKLSVFLIIKAVIALVYAVGFLVAPAPLASLYGVTFSPAAAFMAQLVGACMVGIGLVCWLNRNMTDPDARKGITLALCIGDAVGFIVTLLGQLAGLLNPLGWVNVIIWLLLALGLGYFRFFKSGAS